MLRPILWNLSWRSNWSKSGNHHIRMVSMLSLGNLLIPSRLVISLALFSHAFSISILFAVQFYFIIEFHLLIFFLTFDSVMEIIHSRSSVLEDILSRKISLGQKVRDFVLGISL